MFIFPTINRMSPQAQGLRYCWPFFGYQHKTGPEMFRGAHATLTVSTAGAAGPHSGMVTPIYNGTSHFGTVPIINLGDVNKLTLTFWMYWDTFGSGDDLCLEYTVIADILANGGGNGFFIDPNGGTVFRVGVGQDFGAAVRSFVRPSGAVWHHYSLLMDRTLLWGVPAVYVDGVSVTLTDISNTATPGNFKADSPFYFMSRAGTGLFGAGRLCDVRIYAGKLLTQAEAWALYDPRTRWDLYLPMEDHREWRLAGGAGVSIPALMASYRQRRL